MYLTRHETPGGPRWAARRQLPSAVLPALDLLLQLPKAAIADFLRALPNGGPAAARKLLAPVEPTQEVWAAGVTYLRSRDAREEESAVKDVYERVYEAERPELFFKATAGASPASGTPVRVRDDSELERARAGAGAGHQRARRDRRLHRRQRRVVARHRGREPALPAAGEGLRRLVRARPGHPLGDDRGSAICRSRSRSTRAGEAVFTGETRTSQIKRPLEELVDYLFTRARLPGGRVPDDRHRHRAAGQDFSLAPGDVVAHHHRRRDARERSRGSPRMTVAQPFSMDGEWRQPANRPVRSPRSIRRRGAAARVVPGVVD